MTDYLTTMQRSEMAAALVLRRIMGERAREFSFQAIELTEQRDRYEYEAANGQVLVKGSSSVAMLRGAYDYLRQYTHSGVFWSGKHMVLPSCLPDAAPVRITTPYMYRYCFNVVTYGYTMPYWNWERWEVELDWMALHGINMPLALLANESISARVWKQLGLRDADLDNYFTGPAHLPWHRMGNINGHDGPLPQSWLEEQVVLQHRVLNRMRELGMEPIVPAFAGFVPKALNRLHPKIELHELSWGDFPKEKHTFLLSANTPLFTEIGKLFVKEWEKEFGKFRYYLADAFNEMALPETGRPDTEMLAEYGHAIYQSLAAGNPDAIWVMQGWMFGYQRDIWNKDTVNALLSRVPDDRMLILDLACDYNGVFWRNGANWELFNGFYNKPWIYSVVPTMGGKTVYTGVLEFYAQDPIRALHSPQKGQLIGFGFAPEGIENNEVIYELLADMAWSKSPIPLDSWIEQYCLCRYGAYPEALKKAWSLLQQSCYGTFTDLPRFGWQMNDCWRGTVNNDPRFFQAVELFLSCAERLDREPLYRADAIEMASIFLGLKAEEWFGFAQKAHTVSALEIRDGAAARGLQILSDIDRLLESHPLHRLQRWIDFARAHGIDETQKNFYESNARRIVTVWGPPFNDYAARMWSGLIRDFYRERLARYFEALQTGQTFDRGAWEENWVRRSGVSTITPFDRPLAAAQSLIRVAALEALPELSEL